MSNANDDLQVDEGVNVKLDQPTLYIGNKPLMAYVTSALIQLTNNNRLFIKARGRLGDLGNSFFLALRGFRGNFFL